MIHIPILHPHRIEAFPPVESALREPNGLLAAGGDLSVARLLDAYRRGIFPWYSEGEPILWWSPDPRMVFATDRVHVSTRLRRWLAQCPWQIRADREFAAVVAACAEPRHGHSGTWITDAMFDAYSQLHEQGNAHSVEVYDDAELVGGIYGVTIGAVFFGESMFSRRTNASKVALLALCRVLDGWGFPLLDAQAESAHLRTLGATTLPRREFSRHLADYCSRPGMPGQWQMRFPPLQACDLA